MTVWSSFELQKWLLLDNGIIILIARPTFMSCMQSVLLQCEWPHVQVHLLQPHEPGPADHGAHGPAEEGWHQHSSGSHASPQRHQCWLNKVCILLLPLFLYSVQLPTFWRLGHFQSMLGQFGVSTIHWTLTWTSWSLTCVCDLFALICSRGTSVYSFIWRTFVVSAQNLTLRKSGNGHQARWMMAIHRCGDQSLLCLTFGLQGENT